MKHTLMKLPYELESLEPNISKETLEYHYGKHHATYVKKLNALLENDPKKADLSLEEIIKQCDGGIFNNGAQVYNHDLYWNCLTPNSSKISSDLTNAINRDFGDFDTFKQQFTDACTNLFGSGWVWLSVDEKGHLSIDKTSNADNPLREGKYPILTCDVWEHAFYIDYRNAKPDYLEKWWELVNWDFVSNRFYGCLER
jgi:Fe-Mn family superoxide dismutase